MDAVVIVASVGAVLAERVLLLQPARARPARSKVNKIEFFIGGLNCWVTDRAGFVRFEHRPAWVLRARI